MHRFEEETVVPALGAPPGAAGPEDLQHRRPILLCHPRQHGRLLPNRPAKCHRSTNVGIHSPHTQPNPSTRPRLCGLLVSGGTGIIAAVLTPQPAEVILPARSAPQSFEYSEKAAQALCDALAPPQVDLLQRSITLGSW